jgi:hypothetical protein
MTLGTFSQLSQRIIDIKKRERARAKWMGDDY